MIKLIVLLSLLITLSCSKQPEKISNTSREFSPTKLTATEAKNIVEKLRIDAEKDIIEYNINKLYAQIHESIYYSNCYTNDFTVPMYYYGNIKKYFIDLGYKVKKIHMYGDVKEPLGVLIKWCD